MKNNLIAIMLRKMEWKVHGHENNCSAQPGMLPNRVMKELICKVLSIWIAILVAVSVLVTPANAAAMIGCDGHHSSAHSYDIESSHDLIMQAPDHVEIAHEHPEGHCASHSYCVSAIDTLQGTTDALQAWLIADHNKEASSMLALAAPDGLRRPPRI